MPFRADWQCLMILCLADVNAQADKPAETEQLFVTKQDKTNRIVRIQTMIAGQPKSKAKAAGLKSVFTMGNGELIMTSFGKGNKAVMEKRVDSGKNITAIANPENLTVEQQTKDGIKFRVSSGIVNGATADNPTHRHQTAADPETGLVHTRAALERKYFNKNYPDNIHIQLIHNILDIEKNLTVHMNHIIYELNNMIRSDDGQLEMDDLFQSLNDSWKKVRDVTEKNASNGVKLFRKLCDAKQLLYFGLAIKRQDANGQQEKPDPNTTKLSEEDFFHLFKLLVTVRHQLAHGSGGSCIFEAAPTDPADGVLERLYRERVNDLNDNFVKRSKVNLLILFEAFGCDDIEKKKKCLQDYYDFTVKKTYKNMGFSIRRLREMILAEIAEAAQLRDKKYDSVRQKLYPCMDFAIYRYYLTDDEKINTLVKKLRACSSDFEKEALYSQEAPAVWKAIKGTVARICNKLDGETIKAFESKTIEVNKDMLEGTISDKAHFFTTLIYAMTFFLNGKEINELITNMIHMFESIAAFQDVLKKESLDWKLRGKYSLFNESWQIAEELRNVNSFARMRKEDANAKRVMISEAMDVLGYSFDEETKETWIDQMVSTDGKGTKERGVRNFIINNVIASNQFRYLIRYGNVKRIRAFALNRALVEFTLSELPEEQILRYYTACNADNRGRWAMVYQPRMRGDLANFITNLDFSQLESVRQKENVTRQKVTPDGQYKQKMQAVVRLYLTVLYLIVKNLVYINARYFLAFQCLERDRMLIDPEKWNKADKDNNKYLSEYSYRAFALGFLRDYSPEYRALEANPELQARSYVKGDLSIPKEIKREIRREQEKLRVARYLKQNMNNSDDWAIRVFRNMVEHMDAVRNAGMLMGEINKVQSWFSLYHYIMQRRIQTQYQYDSTHESLYNKGQMICPGLSGKTEKYFQWIEHRHCYSKDFVKALCVPFAYNLPRYKNLTIDALFDRNRPGKDEKNEEPAEEGAGE